MPTEYRGLATAAVRARILSLVDQPVASPQTHTSHTHHTASKPNHLLLQHLATVNGSRFRLRALLLRPAARQIVQQRCRQSFVAAAAAAAPAATATAATAAGRSGARLCHRLVVIGEIPES